MSKNDNFYKVISIDLLGKPIDSVYGTPVYMRDSENHTYVKMERDAERSAFIAPRDDGHIITNGSIFNMSVGSDILRVREFPKTVLLEPYGLLVEKARTSVMNYSAFNKMISDECQMLPTMRDLNTSQILAISNGPTVDVIEGKTAARQVDRFISEIGKPSATMVLLKNYVRYCIEEGRLFLDIPALADFIQEQDYKPFTSAVEEAKRSSFSEDFYLNRESKKQEGDFTSYLVSRALMLQYQGILYSEPSLVEEIKDNSVVEQPNLFYMRIDPLAAIILWGRDRKKENIETRKEMFDGVASIPVASVSPDFGRILDLRLEDKNLIN